jgi:hypothetical protein
MCSGLYPLGLEPKDTTPHGLFGCLFMFFFFGVWSKMPRFACIRGCVVVRLVREMRRLSARHLVAEVRQEAASLALCV